MIDLYMMLYYELRDRYDDVYTDWRLKPFVFIMVNDVVDVYLYEDEIIVSMETQYAFGSEMFAMYSDVPKYTLRYEEADKLCEVIDKLLAYVS